MQARGFTLVEMIISIIISGVLVLGIAGFVQLGTQGYAESIARQRMQMQAQFLLEKLSREVRNAAPNSLRVQSNANQKCFSFYPILYTGIYASVDNTIEFLIGNDEDVTTLPDNVSMVINPSRRADYNSGYDVSGLSKTDGHFTLSSSIRGKDSGSVANRMYIFSTDGEVEYCLASSGYLLRNDVLINDNIVFADSEFDYLQATLIRGGLVHLTLTLQQNGETSVYQQNIQVINVP